MTRAPMAYWNQFPDFPESDVPPMPSDWRDISWCNDSCPSWGIGKLEIYVDYSDPALREWPEIGKRFFVLHIDTRETLVYTNRWSDVLEYVGYSPDAALPHDLGWTR